MMSSSAGSGRLFTFIFAARSFSTLDMFLSQAAISLVGLIPNGLATDAGWGLLAGFARTR